METRQFETRKRDHIRHALDPVNQAQGLSGLDRIHLIHDALPELDFGEIRLDSICLGRPSPTPFFVSGMTAGHADAPKINSLLAKACARRGWAMGVGSQRRDLEGLVAAPEGKKALDSPDSIDSWQKLREEAPGLVLFANLGISQLIGAKTSHVRKLAELIAADALVIHVNALQEVIQPEGTPRFRGGIASLHELAGEVGIPVVLKETGCGFSRATLGKLREVGLAAIDISGLGGTHWGRIEGARADGLYARAAETFATWGETTVDSILAASEALPEVELWASGGVRSGLDAAKALALGAHRVGYAQPALKAALDGAEALDRWMELQEYELKIALFCTGSASPASLRARKRDVWTSSAS